MPDVHALRAGPGAAAKRWFASAAVAGIAAGPLWEGFHDPVSSPNGRMIAGHYTSREARAEWIAVVPLDASAPRLFSNVTIPAEWSGDAKSLLYYVTRAGGTNL